MKKNKYLLDTNVILRHLRQDHPELSSKASEIFKRIATGKSLVFVHILAIHEAVYVLEHLYNKKRKDIARAMIAIFSIKNISIVGASFEEISEIFQLYCASHVDFPDCVFVQMGRSQGMIIVSFDHDFRKLDVTPIDSIQ